jgi:hypothetical protein
MAGLVVPHGKPLCDGANEKARTRRALGMWS